MKQRLDLVRHQPDSECETRPDRVQKEIPPESGVRQHAAQHPFHVGLTHAFVRLCTEQGSHQAGRPDSAALWCNSAVWWDISARKCAPSHGNVILARAGIFDGQRQAARPLDYTASRIGAAIAPGRAAQPGPGSPTRARLVRWAG
jgi:hypothetical protein